MMNSNQLLQGLLGSARVGASPIAPSRAAASADADFGALLARARSGQIESGREVLIGRSVQIELSPEQRTRIAASLDVAEANGAQRAMIVIDGVGLMVDVASRTITGVMNLADTPDQARFLGNVDSVVVAPGARSGATNPSRLLAGSPSSASILPPPNVNPLTRAAIDLRRAG